MLVGFSVSLAGLELGWLHLGVFAAEELIGLYRHSAFSAFPGGCYLMTNIELLLLQG